MPILIRPTLQNLKIITNTCHKMARAVIAITHPVKALMELVPTLGSDVLLPLPDESSFRSGRIALGLMLTITAAIRAGSEPSYKR